MTNDSTRQLPLWEGAEEIYGPHRRHSLSERSLRTQLEDAGLARVADAVIDLSRPAVGLHTVRCAESDVPVGASKLGGAPDLPPATAWPTWQDKPLSFVAQINLAEVAADAPPHILPPTGLLSFFYDIVASPWGFDPKERGAWRVLYSPLDAPVPDAPLERRPLPPALVAPDPLWLTPCALAFSKELTPPAWHSTDLARLGLDREERERYDEWWFALTERQAPVHRLLGRPYLVQGDGMELECQLASHGVYLGDSKAYTDPRYAHLKAGARDWQLLLQLDSDETADLLWGDDGMLYWWIRRQDLHARDFSSTWLVLQCY